MYLWEILITWSLRKLHWCLFKWSIISMETDNSMINTYTVQWGIHLIKQIKSHHFLYRVPIMLLSVISFVIGLTLLAQFEETLTQPWNKCFDSPPRGPELEVSSVYQTRKEKYVFKKSQLRLHLSSFCGCNPRVLYAQASFFIVFWPFSVGPSVCK